MRSPLRRLVRAAVTGVTVGALGLGSAWAGAGLIAPAETPNATDDVTASPDPVGSPTSAETAMPDVPVSIAAAFDPEHVASAVETMTAGRLEGGWFRAGAAVASLVPDPDRWVQGDDCTGAPEQLYTPLTPDGCLITFDMRWADGVDDANPIEVRSVAIGNGQDLVVLSTLDLVGYMAAYPDGTCDRCGLDEIAEDLAADLGIPKANFTFSSSHTHAAPSTIADGPAWYYEQIRDAIHISVREAITSAAANPAVRIESGSTRARAINTDRRIVDRAVPDDELVWLRAFVPGTGKGNSPNAADTTVATLGNFAVHATIRTNNAQLHSGAVGPFNRRLEEVLGGTGLWFPGGLGDQRVDRGFGVNGIGITMADLVVDDVERGGTLLGSNDIEVVRTTVQIPVENQFFAGALAAGYAIRSFQPPYGGGPVAVEVTKGGANKPSCVASAPLHVVGPVSAIRLGERPPAGKVEVGDEDRRPVPTDNIVLVQAPGELFASIALVTKDYLSRSNAVFVQAMTNDTLGYMVPANQFDQTAGQGGGLAHNIFGTGNYEEALSLGRCTGDIVAGAMLEMGERLGVMGEGERP